MKLNTVNKKIDLISNIRMAVGFGILTCWFFPVVFTTGVAFLYPFSFLLVILFIVLVYMMSRLKEFRDYLIQREILNDRKRSQEKCEYKYTSNQLNRWTDLISKINLDKSAHWEDLDLIKSGGLLQAIHSTGNAQTLQFLVQMMRRSPILTGEIKLRQQKVRFFTQGPRRKTLALLSQNTENQNIQAAFQLLKENLVEGRHWLTIVYAYYFCLWGLYLWFFYSGKTVFGALLFGLFFLIPWAGNSVKIFKTYGWVNGFEAQLSRLQKIKKSIRLYSRKAERMKIPVMTSFRDESNGLDFENALVELNRIIGAMGIRQNFILYGLVHAILPWDFFWTTRAESLRKKLEAIYLRWIDDVTEMEGFCLLAEYSQNSPNAVWPVILDQDARLLAKGVRHPLIPESYVVDNDVELNADTRKCLLITGSNMSGKSTFLRTLGINLVLMRLGAKVQASLFESSPFQVLTSLKRVDSLEESLSTFYSEVKNLKEIRDECISHSSLYLIDEIFRGTNNRERLIGAQRYIKALLQSPSLGLVTTHDLELSQMDSEYKNLVNEHFADRIENGKMIFDYKKKNGPCPSTNALKVMEMEGVF